MSEIYSPCAHLDDDPRCPFRRSKDWEKAHLECEHYAPSKLIGWGIYVFGPEKTQVSRGLFPTHREAEKYLKRCTHLKTLFIGEEVINHVPIYCGLCPWHDSSCQFEPVCVLMDDTSRNLSHNAQPKDCPWGFFNPIPSDGLE